MDPVAVDPAHFAGMLEVHPVHHADRARGDEVTAHHSYRRALHGGVGQAHGQQRFHVCAQPAAGRLDVLQHGGIGDPYAVMELAGQARSLQLRLDLGAGAVYQHQPHAQAVQQRYIVDDIGEIGVPGRLTREDDDKNAAAVRVDIGRAVAEPADVLGALRAHDRPGEPLKAARLA